MSFLVSERKVVWKKGNIEGKVTWKDGNMVLSVQKEGKVSECNHFLASKVR